MQQPNLQQQNVQQQNRRKKKEKNPDCNCQKGVERCPLKGKCQKEKNVIYVGKVTRLDNFEQKRYTGVHEGPFKGRIYGHNSNIKHRHQTGTGLSKYVWQLKDNKPHPIPYEIEWEILAKEKPYNPVTGVCRLCLLEAHYLMFDKVNTTLNTKDEYFSVCPHKRNYLLYKG